MGTSNLRMVNNKMGMNQTTVLTVRPKNAVTPRRFLNVFLSNSSILSDRELHILALFRLVLRATSKTTVNLYLYLR